MIVYQHEHWPSGTQVLCVILCIPQIFTIIENRYLLYNEMGTATSYCHTGNHKNSPNININRMKATHAGSSSLLFLPKKHYDERLRSSGKLSTFSLQNSSPGGIGTRNWNFSANSYFEDRSIAVLQKLKDK